jgi:hypothetical protein
MADFENIVHKAVETFEDTLGAAKEGIANVAVGAEQRLEDAEQQIHEHISAIKYRESEHPLPPEAEREFNASELKYVERVAGLIGQLLIGSQLPPVVGVGKWIVNRFIPQGNTDDSSK